MDTSSGEYDLMTRTITSTHILLLRSYTGTDVLFRF